MIEDVFQGNRIEENTVFTEDTIKWEFEAFKHQMFILRQRATQKELANHEILLSKIYHDEVLKQAIPSMTYLVLLECLVPVSTACVERVFSLMNSLCTPLTASLKQDTLDSLMKINFEGAQALSLQQLEKALDYFRTKENRMLQILIFQSVLKLI